MMIYLLLRYTIQDYGRWKEAFDIHFSARQASGATDEAWVLRDVDDPHEITVLVGWRDLAQAKTFIQSVSWQTVLQQMGVVGVPEVRFLSKTLSERV